MSGLLLARKGGCMIKKFKLRKVGMPFSLGAKGGVDCWALMKQYLKEEHAINLPHDEYYKDWKIDPLQTIETAFVELRKHVQTIEPAHENMQKGDIALIKHKGTPFLVIVTGENKALSVHVKNGVTEIDPRDYTIVELFRPKGGA
jgi:hypothetical protein